MKILISGGHLTPALAFLDYALLQKQEVVFVGRVFAQKQNQQLSREEQEVGKRNVTFIPFSSGKLNNATPWGALIAMPQICGATLHAWRIFKIEKPDIFVSFGGYLAAHLALVAFLCRVPIITHEQTRTSGLANKFIAWFATAIGVAYEESMSHFAANKTHMVGNPVRRNILDKHAPQPSWFNPKNQKPILYITGGSQGSQIINMTLWQVLPKLTPDWTIIHQCGSPTRTMNYKLELEQRRKSLPLTQQGDYYVFEWLNEAELAWIYRNVQCIIARAGANTVQELLVLGKPAIFVPLLHAHNDEQTKNALAVVESGAAMMISQKEFNGCSLLEAISDFQKHFAGMLRKAKQNQKNFDADADVRLYELVRKVVDEK